MLPEVAVIVTKLEIFRDGPGLGGATVPGRTCSFGHSAARTSSHGSGACDQEQQCYCHPLRPFAQSSEKTLSLRWNSHQKQRGKGHATPGEPLPGLLALRWLHSRMLPQASRGRGCGGNRQCGRCTAIRAQRNGCRSRACLSEITGDSSDTSGRIHSAGQRNRACKSIQRACFDGRIGRTTYRQTYWRRIGHDLKIRGGIACAGIVGLPGSRSRTPDLRHGRYVYGTQSRSLIVARAHVVPCHHSITARGIHARGCPRLAIHGIAVGRSIAAGDNIMEGGGRGLRQGVEDEIGIAYATRRGLR